MAQVNHDIPKFNAYVKHQLQALSARGATTDDLLSNLFKGYLACTDRIFRRYIEKKQELYEEGTHITVNELMLWAKNKYDIIKEKNLWNALSPEQKEILALKSQINNLSKDKKKDDKGKTKPGNGNRGKGKRRLPGWFFKEPPANELNKAKVWQEFNWFWCGKSTGGKCDRYRQHMGSACRGLARSVTAPTDTKPAPTKAPNKPKPTKRKDGQTSSQSQKKLKFEKAIEAVSESNVVGEDEISI